MLRRSFLGTIAAAVAARQSHSSELPSRASRPHPGTIEIGHRKELFVDDLLIDEATRISTFIPRPEKYIDNPVLKPDRPWEPIQGQPGSYGVGIAGQAILFDETEKIFKMWYLGMGPPGHSFWCYATSNDGYHWEKPALGIHEFQGSKENNILGVYADPAYFNVIKDEHDPDPKRRYKAMGEYDGPRPNQGGGAVVAFSPDGLRWTPHPDIVMHHGPNLGDAPTMLGWDHLRRKYVCYPRPGHPLAPEINGIGQHRHIRALGYSESDDFIHWTPNRPMLMPDRDDRVDFQYERFLVGVTGSFYIGLIPVRESFERTFEVWALASRDGFHWTWLDRHRPLIERGEVGSYDGSGVSCSGPVFHDGKVWIYFNGTRYKHRRSINIRPGVNEMTSISLATLPMDRWVGLLAGLRVGSIITRPLVFEGSHLSADIVGAVPVDLDRAERPGSRAGRSFDDCEVRVSVTDQSGGPIEGFTPDRAKPVTTGGVQEITWEGGRIAALAGKPVRLRFELRNAALFSIQFI
jgi:hypothetical protein